MTENRIRDVYNGVNYNGLRDVYNDGLRDVYNGYRALAAKKLYDQSEDSFYSNSYVLRVVPAERRKEMQRMCQILREQDIINGISTNNQ